MMLNFAAYVFAFLAYYAVGFAFQFGAVAINAAPANIGGTPTLNGFLIGGGQWGFLGGKGFFLSGPAYDAGSNVLTLFQVVFMETAGYIIVGAICERITFWAFILCELFVGAILYPVFGCWVWGGGWMSQLGSTMQLGHDTWISPARPSFTPGDSARWRWLSFLVRVSANTRDGPPPFRLTTSCSS
jgi:Amt family ammonium transporter